MNTFFLLLVASSSICISFDIKKEPLSDSNLIGRYCIPLSIGIKNNEIVSKVNLLLDSANTSTWISSNLCRNHCHTNDTYNIDTSDEYKQTSSNLNTIDFFGGYVEGYPSIDSICIYNNSSVCQFIKGFPFIASSYEENFNGLSTHGSLNLLNFTEYLYSKYQISNKIVTIDLREENSEVNKSKVYFFEKPDDGKFESKKVRNILFTEPMKANLTEMKIFEYKFSPYSKYVIFDTSTQFIHIPLHDFMNINKIINSIMKKNCQLNEKMYYCIINKNDFNLTISKLPDIQIQLNGIWLRISLFPRLYNYSISEDKIIIQFPFIITSSLDHWILGTTFFDQYYAVIDYERSTIGFQKKINFGGKYFYWLPLEIGFCGILLTFALIYFFIKYCFHPKSEE